MEKDFISLPTRSLRNTIPVPAPKPLPLEDVPMWTQLPYDTKYPLYESAKTVATVSREKLGKSLYSTFPSKEFDLTTSTLPVLDTSNYDSLHDPHLCNYFHPSSPRYKSLVKRGLVTEDGKVKSRLQEYNQYRMYLYNLWAMQVNQLSRNQISQEKNCFENILKAQASEDSLFTDVTEKLDKINVEEILEETATKIFENKKIVDEHGFSPFVRAIIQWKIYQEKLQKDFRNCYPEIKQWLSDKTKHYRQFMEKKLNTRRKQDKKLRSRWERICENSRARLEKELKLRELEKERRRTLSEQRYNRVKKLWSKNEREMMQKSRNVSKSLTSLLSQSDQEIDKDDTFDAESMPPKETLTEEGHTPEWSKKDPSFVRYGVESSSESDLAFPLPSFHSEEGDHKQKTTFHEIEDEESSILPEKSPFCTDTHRVAISDVMEISKSGEEIRAREKKVSHKLRLAKEPTDDETDKSSEITYVFETPEDFQIKKVIFEVSPKNTAKLEQEHDMDKVKAKEQYDEMVSTKKEILQDTSILSEELIKQDEILKEVDEKSVKRKSPPPFSFNDQSKLMKFLYGLPELHEMKNTKLHIEEYSPTVESSSMVSIEKSVKDMALGEKDKSAKEYSPIETSSIVPNEENVKDMALAEKDKDAEAYSPVETASIVLDEKSVKDMALAKKDKGAKEYSPVETSSIVPDEKSVKDMALVEKDNGAKEYSAFETASIVPDKQMVRDMALAEKDKGAKEYSPVETASIVTDERSVKDMALAEKDKGAKEYSPVETSSILPDEKSVKDMALVEKDNGAKEYSAFETASIVPDEKMVRDMALAEKDKGAKENSPVETTSIVTGEKSAKDMALAEKDKGATEYSPVETTSIVRGEKSVKDMALAEKDKGATEYSPVETTSIVPAEKMVKDMALAEKDKGAKENSPVETTSIVTGEKSVKDMALAEKDKGAEEDSPVETTRIVPAEKMVKDMALAEKDKGAKEYSPVESASIVTGEKSVKDMALAEKDKGAKEYSPVETTSIVRGDKSVKDMALAEKDKGAKEYSSVETTSIVPAEKMVKDMALAEKDKGAKEYSPVETTSIVTGEKSVKDMALAEKDKGAKEYSPVETTSIVPAEKMVKDMVLAEKDKGSKEYLSVKKASIVSDENMVRDIVVAKKDEDVKEYLPVFEEASMVPDEKNVKHMVVLGKDKDVKEYSPLVKGVNIVPDEESMKHMAVDKKEDAIKEHLSIVESARKVPDEKTAKDIIIAKKNDVNEYLLESASMVQDEKNAKAMIVAKKDKDGKAYSPIESASIVPHEKSVERSVKDMALAEKDKGVKEYSPVETASIVPDEKSVKDMVLAEKDKGAKEYLSVKKASIVSDKNMVRSIVVAKKDEDVKEYLPVFEDASMVPDEKNVKHMVVLEKDKDVKEFSPVVKGVNIVPDEESMKHMAVDKKEDAIKEHSSIVESASKVPDEKTAKDIIIAKKNDVNEYLLESASIVQDEKNAKAMIVAKKDKDGKEYSPIESASIVPHEKSVKHMAVDKKDKNVKEHAPLVESASKVSDEKNAKNVIVAKKTEDVKEYLAKGASMVPDEKRIKDMVAPEKDEHVTECSQMVESMNGVPDEKSWKDIAIAEKDESTTSHSFKTYMANILAGCGFEKHGDIWKALEKSMKYKKTEHQNLHGLNDEKLNKRTSKRIWHELCTDEMYSSPTIRALRKGRVTFDKYPTIFYPLDGSDIKLYGTDSEPDEPDETSEEILRRVFGKKTIRPQFDDLFIKNEYKIRRMQKLEKNKHERLASFFETKLSPKTEVNKKFKTDYIKSDLYKYRQNKLDAEFFDLFLDRRMHLTETSKTRNLSYSRLREYETYKKDIPQIPPATKAAEYFSSPRDTNEDSLKLDSRTKHAGIPYDCKKKYFKIPEKDLGFLVDDIIREAEIPKIRKRKEDLSDVQKKISEDRPKQKLDSANEIACDTSKIVSQMSEEKYDEKIIEFNEGNVVDKGEFSIESVTKSFPHSEKEDRESSYANQADTEKDSIRLESLHVLTDESIKLSQTDKNNIKCDIIEELRSKGSDLPLSDTIKHPEVLLEMSDSFQKLKESIPSEPMLFMDRSVGLNSLPREDADERLGNMEKLIRAKSFGYFGYPNDFPFETSEIFKDTLIKVHEDLPLITQHEYHGCSLKEKLIAEIENILKFVIEGEKDLILPSDIKALDASDTSEPIQSLQTTEVLANIKKRPQQKPRDIRDTSHGLKRDTTQKYGLIDSARAYDGIISESETDQDEISITDSNTVSVDIDTIDSPSRRDICPDLEYDNFELGHGKEHEAKSEYYEIRTDAGALDHSQIDQETNAKFSYFDLQEKNDMLDANLKFIYKKDVELQYKTHEDDHFHKVKSFLPSKQESYIIKGLHNGREKEEVHESLSDGVRHFKDKNASGTKRFSNVIPTAESHGIEEEISGVKAHKVNLESAKFEPLHTHYESVPKDEISDESLCLFATDFDNTKSNIENIPIDSDIQLDNGEFFKNRTIKSLSRHFKDDTGYISDKSMYCNPNSDTEIIPYFQHSEQNLTTHSFDDNDLKDFRPVNLVTLNLKFSDELIDETLNEKNITEILNKGISTVQELLKKKSFTFITPVEHNENAESDEAKPSNVQNTELDVLNQDTSENIARLSDDEVNSVCSTTVSTESGTQMAGAQIVIDLPRKFSRSQTSSSREQQFGVSSMELEIKPDVSHRMDNEKHRKKNNFIRKTIGSIQNRNATGCSNDRLLDHYSDKNKKDFITKDEKIFSEYPINDQWMYPLNNTLLSENEEHTVEREEKKIHTKFELNQDNNFEADRHASLKSSVAKSGIKRNEKHFSNISLALRNNAKIMDIVSDRAQHIESYLKNDSSQSKFTNVNEVVIRDKIEEDIQIIEEKMSKLNI